MNRTQTVPQKQARAAERSGRGLVAVLLLAGASGLLYIALARLLSASV